MGYVEFLSTYLLGKYLKISPKLCQPKENYKVISVHRVRYSILTRIIFPNVRELCFFIRIIHSLGTEAQETSCSHSRSGG